MNLRSFYQFLHFFQYFQKKFNFLGSEEIAQGYLAVGLVPKKPASSISFFHDGCGEIGGVRRVDELSFNTGDLFTISRKTEFDAEGNELDSEWWWAKRASNDNGGVDEEGYVPRNFLGMWPRIQSR